MTEASRAPHDHASRAEVASLLVRALEEAPTRVVIIGGGLAGLVAARDAARPGFEVTVLEASETPGGAVASHTVAGVRLDAGAESFATRGGHVASLLEELGLGSAVVAPNPTGAWLQTPRGAVPAPKGGLLGIPGVPLSTEVIAAIGWGPALRAYLDRLMPVLKVGKERDFGRLVRRRMGRAVHDWLVAPVTGGVYSADPDLLDTDVVAPGLNEAMTRAGSLSGGVALLRSGGTDARTAGAGGAGDRAGTAGTGVAGTGEDRTGAGGAVEAENASRGMTGAGGPGGDARVGAGTTAAGADAAGTDAASAGAVWLGAEQSGAGELGAGERDDDPGRSSPPVGAAPAGPPANAAAGLRPGSAVGGLVGGMARLIDALVADIAARGGEVRTGTRVIGVRRADDRMDAGDSARDQGDESGTNAAVAEGAVTNGAVTGGTVARAAETDGVAPPAAEADDAAPRAAEAEAAAMQDSGSGGTAPRTAVSDVGTALDDPGGGGRDDRIGEDGSAGRRAPGDEDGPSTAAGEPTAWRIDLADGEVLDADVVLIATSAGPALELLGGISDELATLGGLDWPEPTDVELVTLVLDAPALDAAPRGTGLLVAEGTPGVRAKALTHASAKWTWLADALPAGRHVIRLSYGRAASASDGGETTRLDDTALRETALEDASTLLGIPLEASMLVDWDRVRWTNAPQLAIRGQRERVDAVRSGVGRTEGLEVTGSWLCGTGTASVVPDARGAAARIRGLRWRVLTEKD